ncbi:TldD/PmbA family protein, partial [archaeon]|nr:TldD/PmbA family protein [archaeon]
MADIEKFARIAAKKADEAEVFQNEASVMLVRSRIDKVCSTESKTVLGYGLRVLLGGRVGASYFSREQDFELALERAISTANHTQILDMGFASASKFPKLEGCFDRKVEALSPDSLVGIMADIIKEQKKPAIELLENQLSTSVSLRRVATSQGCYAETRETHSVFDSSVKCEEATGMQHTESRGLVEVLGPARLGVETALKTRRGMPVKGEHDIYLYKFAVEEFIENILFPAVDASAVARKQSPWHDKLGAQVANESLTVTDDPLLDGGIASTPFDDEGTACTTKPVIKNGKLASFLSDRASASLLQGKSSGNGFRPSFSAPPTPAFTNLSLDMKEREKMSEATGVVVQIV